MIVVAMILAVQRLREMAVGGGPLARWTIGYYVLTTLIAVMHSAILVGVCWSKLMVPASSEDLTVSEDDEETIEERSAVTIHEVVVDMFQSLIPDNVVGAMAENALLSVLVMSVVVGYLLKPRSAILKVVREIEELITTLIRVLIYLAPIGVFFLILSNLMKLDISSIGRNLGILIGGTLAGMVLHLGILLPIIFFAITRKNPYAYWAKCSPAWITAWGSASSAAT